MALPSVELGRGVVAKSLATGKGSEVAGGVTRRDELLISYQATALERKVKTPKPFHADQSQYHKIS